MLIEIAVGSAILLALVLLATVDMAFTHLSDISLRRLTTDADDVANPRSIALLRDVVNNRSRFRIALSSSIHILLISFTVLVTIAVLEFTQDRRWIVIDALLIALVSTALFRQILPRLIVRNDPEGKLLLLLPITRPLYAFAGLISRPFASSQQTDEEEDQETIETNETAEERAEVLADDLQALIDVGAAEGIIEEKDRELIESMIEFSGTRAGEIMTPRTEIVALSVDATVRDARDLIVEQKYSRLPVYRDSIDNIEGVIYVRDLIQAWAAGRDDQPIADILREPFFIPETKSAAELLKRMQTNHVQIAIVIDEYGGVAGIVTVEDIVEEIVGEIEDEDIEEEEIIEIIEGHDGYYDVIGSTEIDKIERLFDIELEDDEYTTIAGMITRETGHVAKIGEQFTLKGLDIEVISADEKRIHLVRLRPHTEPEPGLAEQQPAES
ncbi:MAG: HlyC/CorC family transporter [Blastocatellia bacterium]|nr:HlyC/CorC family transporter [Blastocatellia bacterium]